MKMIRRFIFYTLFGGAVLFCAVHKADSAIVASEQVVQMPPGFTFTIDRKQYCEVLTALPGAIYNAEYCPHPKPERKPV